MTWEFVPEPGVLRLRLHLNTPPEVVYRFLSTDEGRASFWAEEAREQASVIHWEFPSGVSADLAVIGKEPGVRFACQYLEGTELELELEPDRRGGTDLTLTHRGIAEESMTEVAAGWGSVLMNLKAVVDNGIDLRNHSSDLNWTRGFLDN
jgi:uncharacterized protein YndB with AHSA1/START domain